jgi:6-phosphogluconolactonase
VLDVQITEDEGAAAHIAADLLAHAVLGAHDARGRAVIALSGGRGPEPMLADLAARHLPWSTVTVLQVDERVVPDGSAERNLGLIERTLGRVVPASNIHPMPVSDAAGQPLEGAALEQAADAYAAVVEEVCGGVIDCAHLGLGPDGHTASLVPDDAVLSEGHRAVAVTGAPYQGCRRMTLTYPALAAARSLVWLVTGDDKADMVPRLVRADATVPGGRVRADRAILVVDHAAAAGLDDA